MFGSRRRRASNPALNVSNVSAAATTAATSAFLHHRSSNASLSSAAAAAALKARPTTPTSVADVQTKRTLKRSGSTSSMGSSVAGSVDSRPTLQRRGSSGSMSERTFRDPSPSTPVPSAVDAPPVPVIPESMKTAHPTKAPRRAASMEAPALRISSPPPSKGNGRGSSLGPAISSAVPPGRARMSSLSSVSELTGIERPGSRGSVNFSYPTNSRPTSPVGQTRLTYPSRQRTLSRITSPTNQKLVYDPNTRSFLPAADLLAIEQQIQDAANKSVKKKKRIAPHQAQGTHLSGGTVGGRPRGTAIDAMEEDRAQTIEPAARPIRAPASAPIMTSMEEPTTTVPKKKKKKKTDISESESEASYVPNSSDNDSDYPSRPQKSNTRAGALLAKKPSIVREDRQREEEEDNSPNGGSVNSIAVLKARPTSPSPLSKSVAGRGHGQGQALASAAFAQERQQSRSSSQPAPTPAEGLTSSGSIRGGRVQSLSPARNAHFAAATTPDNLIVRHQPPPRSVSPRKSALKHSNSPRGSSPSEDLSGPPNAAHRLSLSEMSNASSAPSEDHLIPRKKSVRVSFDDDTTAIISPPSPPPPNPKRAWFNLARGKKKEIFSMDEEDDEIMQPRPALPSFGSVREKKIPYDVEDRPLVRPAEPQQSAQSPPFTTPASEVAEYPFGQSNDHAVGAIIALDSASKNAANISKSREPLPPQVLSVEGNGDYMDTDSSLESQDESGLDARPVTEATLTDEQSSDRTTNGLPEIAILQPTPTLEETDARREWPDMPGGFPQPSSTSDSAVSQTRDNAQSVVIHQTADTSPAIAEIAEPLSQSIMPVSSVLDNSIVESPISAPIIEENEDSDQESIYSDAAEEISEPEGDGFMSLDAVVESPVVAEIPGLAISTPPDSPTIRSTKERAYRKSQLSRKSSEPGLEEGWDKAQEYWSSLSVERKRQLELEAREEAEEADSEEMEIVVAPAPKPKKKKKATTMQVALQTRTTNGRPHIIQPGAKTGPDGAPVMRTSMRSPPPNPPHETHMRKSMRISESGRRSLREAPTTLQSMQSVQKNRPVSLPSPEIRTSPVVTNHMRNMSASSAATASLTASTKLTQPPLRRRGSGDSDSSFKRARPSNEGINFRRSMRGRDEPLSSGRQQSPMSSGRFSIRPLSPTSSTFRRPFSQDSSMSSTNMKASMRGSSSTPSMRIPKTPAGDKSPRRFGFGRSSSSKATPKSRPQRMSRFADSSDEDEERPTFRSRFVDSSDEDESIPRSTGMNGSIRNNAPVRAIPRLVGTADGDSSDLPDSDDEKPPAVVPQASQNGNPANVVQGTTVASGSLRRSGSGRGTIASPTSPTAISNRPNHTRKRSFMSILGRRKADPSSKVRKADIESAARRDTPLERSQSELHAMRRQESNSAQPRSPKLQKRNPLSRENSSSWPLPAQETPPQVLTSKDERPITSDGVNAADSSTNGTKANARPDLLARRFTATGLTTVDLDTVDLDTPKKKKKFQALRKIFKLLD
ncbi:hypothetical protein B7494_g2475 [Chlorociboria aeruginascens]|nr:hypothetical protein B7494_g2475 [Chlorociboria aeruginascens]